VGRERLAWNLEYYPHRDPAFIVSPSGPFDRCSVGCVEAWGYHAVMAGCSRRMPRELPPQGYYQTTRRPRFVPRDLRPRTTCCRTPVLAGPKQHSVYDDTGYRPWGCLSWPGWSGSTIGHKCPQVQPAWSTATAGQKRIPQYPSGAQQLAPPHSGYNQP